MTTGQTGCRIEKVLGKTDACPPGTCAFAQACTFEHDTAEDDAFDALVEMRRTVELLRS
jgi:hypothetical protein